MVSACRSEDERQDANRRRAERDPGAASRAKAVRAPRRFAAAGARDGVGQGTSLNFVLPVFARSQEAGRPEDQDQHEQQIGKNRSDLRHGHVPDIEQNVAGSGRDAHAAKTSASERLSETAKVCTSPISSEARERAWTASRDRRPPRPRTGSGRAAPPCSIASQAQGRR